MYYYIYDSSKYLILKKIVAQDPFWFNHNNEIYPATSPNTLLEVAGFFLP